MKHDDHQNKDKMKKDKKEHHEAHENKEVEKLEAKLEETNQKYLRALADYNNLSNRTAEEKVNIHKFASEKIIKSFLEIVDDLEACASHIDDVGLKGILTKMHKLLESEGVSKIETDKKFDPEMHEAIEVSAGKKDVILKVHRDGYLLNGKLLRPALVAVGNGS